MKKCKIILASLLVLTLFIGLFPFAMNTATDKERNLTKSGSNIQVNLFDYSTGNSETVSPSKNYNSGINKNHEFKFLSDAGNLPSNHMNKWTGSHGFPRTKIVETKLVNGYPKLVKGESLSYLFDSSTQTGKTAYMNVDGLFQVDDKGYTYFNSDSNYAEFNTKTNSFVLKDVIKRNGEPFPCFYPFDSYESSNKKAQGTNGIDTSLHSFTANNANHYFGMTVETEFYTLENGKVYGEDMVFNFSGDDDVWVFIDDTLVLDIGGVHTAVSGSINFNTGDVCIANDIDEQKTQDNIYKNSKIDNSDYTKHVLKVFYLERGNSASNCNISFNLPTIPEESVIVTKKVVDNNNKLMDEDLLIDFRFLIKKNGQPLANTTYTVLTDTSSATNSTDENGYFYLKNGYTAAFPNFTTTDNFEILEVDYALNGYNVSVNGCEIVVMNKSNEITNIIPTASSGTLYVKDTQNVLFNNIVEKLTDLYITKEIEEDSPNLINKEFDMRLELNGIPYVGNYSIDNKTYKTNNGKFTLKDDDTIKIEDLAYGTSFKVSEIKDESYTQNYTFSTNIYDNNIEDENEKTVAYGRISGVSEVVSINGETPNPENSRDLTIKKEWKNDKEKNRPDNITFNLYKNGNLFISDIQLTKENNWSYTFHNLFIYDGDKKNVYSVKETKIGNELIVDNIAMGYYSETFTDENSITIVNTYGGDITIKKTIDDRIDKNPIFVFKITDRFNNIYYEYIKLSPNENTKEIVVKNLPLGNCTIEEVDVFRYEVIENSTMKLTITKETQTVDFNNKLVAFQYYTDIDCIKNHFVVGEEMVRTE